MRKIKIVVGHADSFLAKSINQMITAEGFDIQSADRGSQVMDFVKITPLPDLIVLHQNMEHPNALEVCRELKGKPEYSMIPVLLIAPNATEPYLPQAVQAGFDDILNNEFESSVLHARVRSLLRVKFLSEERDDAESVLYALARALEAKDTYTLGHADRVGQFAVSLGQKMGVSARELETLRKGGMLHDIGKIAIPDSILLKPGKFSPEEFEVMKRHPTLGCDICEKLHSIQDALPLIRHHHEKMDGSGYPDRLKGDAISPLVRIVTVVDIYDALRSRRSYKDAFTIDKSLQIMWDEANKGWWDKSVLSAWEQICSQQN